MRVGSVAYVAVAVSVLVPSAAVASTAANVSSVSDFSRQLIAQPVCNLESDVDYIGNDVAYFPGAPSDCCRLCIPRVDCGAFTWTNSNGGMCWLKSGKGATKPSSGAKSGVVVAGDPAGCPFEIGVDYIGNDIASVSASSANCCDYCKARPGCGAYTWSDHNGGTCWMKSGKGASVAKAGVVSGVITLSTICTVEQGVDYVGNDIASTPGGATDCCVKCSRYLGCGAYSWSDYNGGTCWLKSGQGETKSSPGVISGVLA